MKRTPLSASLTLLLGAWLLETPAVLHAQPEWPDEIMQEVEEEEPSFDPSAVPAPVTLHGSLQAGLGMGGRDLQWPGEFGLSEAQTGPYLAYDVTAHFGLDKGPRALGLRIEYQSSLNLTMSEQRVGAAPQELHARSHHVLSGLFLNRRIGEWFALGTTLGYEARNLSTVTRDSQLPRYTLSGPFATLLLEVRVFSGRVWLRAEPQVQAILQISESMRNRGVGPVGVAGGGEFVLGLKLVRRARLELAFNASRARVSGDGPALQDGMRFLTLRVGGEL